MNRKPLAYAEKGLNELAIKHARKAVEIQPNNKDYRKFLDALLAEEKGDN